MRIAIDIDGVLRDSVDMMVKIYNLNFGTDMKTEDVKFYSVKEAFPLIEQKLKIDPHDFFFSRDNGEKVNRLSDAFEGVIDALQEAKEKGHSINIISYQPSYKNKLHTLMWLEDVRIPYDSITFCTKKAKNILDVDVIVDDNPQYFQEINADRLILINRSYNEKTEQYQCVDTGEYVYTKDKKVKIERFDSIVDFLETLEPCDKKKLF